MNCLHSAVVLRALTAAAMTAALVACSIPKLGPEPDNYVGPGNDPPQRLSDANLEAVIPVAPGDTGGGAVPLPLPALQPLTPPGSQPAAQPATQVATAPATRPAIVTDTQPTERDTTTPVPDSVSVQQAILVALMNNVQLRVDKYNVPIQRTAEEARLAQFDPTVNFALQGGRTQGAGFANNVDITDSIAGNASITEYLPTGTTIQAGVTTSNSFYNESSASLGANLSVTQALLRGASVQANLASLRQAELATKSTQYQLRFQAEGLVAAVEDAYWNLANQERQVTIYQDALTVAEEQLADTNTRIDLGAVAASERPAAAAEVASRRVALISATTRLELARMTFLRLLTPSQGQFWDKSVNLATFPFIPLGTIDPPESHVDVALRMQPAINQTKLQLKRGDLEIIRTKDGLLPRLDLFVRLGKTSLASSLGESVLDLNGLGYSAVVGVQGDWDPINRAANANYRASQLSRDQLDETLANLTQSVKLDVRQQYILVTGTRNQIDATHAARIAQEQKFDVEQAKFRAGNGKSLDVAIAQRDLVQAQVNEVAAVTDHLRSLVELYRLEGSLLLRRGLQAPGAVPVEGENRR